MHNSCQPLPRGEPRRGERWSQAGICAGWQDFLTSKNSEQASPKIQLTGYSPDLVRALGATYHTDTVATVGFEPDIIVECTAPVSGR
jgi:hypothetical protein